MIHDAIAEKLNKNLEEDVYKLLSIEARGSKSADMDVEGINPLATSFQCERESQEGIATYE